MSFGCTSGGFTSGSLVSAGFVAGWVIAGVLAVVEFVFDVPGVVELPGVAAFRFGAAVALGAMEAPILAGMVAGFPDATLAAVVPLGGAPPGAAAPAGATPLFFCCASLSSAA